MYKHILCPIDGSSSSSRGMREAIDLAKDQNAELRFLHIIDTYFPIPDTAGEIDMLYLIEAQRNFGEQLLKKAKEKSIQAGVAADTKMMETVGRHVSRLIVDHASEWSADLIVMGTHGLRGIERLMMGSDAEAVARTSPAPVLLVRALEEGDQTS